MEGSHAGEDGEHLLRGVWVVPPILSAEGDLGYLLPGAEAVVDGAAAKAPQPEGGVNAAAEVCPQIETRLTGRLGEREVRRGREGRRDTAERAAAVAIRAQAAETGVIAFGGGYYVVTLLRHGERTPVRSN